MLRKKNFTVYPCLACVAFHNFLMAGIKSDLLYQDDFVDIEFQGKAKPRHWRETIANNIGMLHVENFVSNSYGKDARKVR